MLLWIAGIVLTVLALILIISYVCFRMAFYVPKNFQVGDIPEGEIYEPFREQMLLWIEETKSLPYEEFSITSFDGLTLYGKYYEYEKGAPIEIMFHGYRGSAQRDLCGGVQRCFRLKRSALIVDQRCSGKSEGNVITFGINEHKDCLCWVDFTVKHFGNDVKIILTGISMGASTVLMASVGDLPENVIGILADCGYDKPETIIKSVIGKMGLPVNISYFFVKLGARIYGHFDLEESSPQEAIKKCKVPVIFFHGEMDDYVPSEMSKINFDACPTRKMLVNIPNAGHGLSYLVEPEKYVNALKEFFG